MADLVQALRGAHGALDVEGADVLPVLLEQGHKEVDGLDGVGDNLVLGHADVANGNTDGEHLLHLELDGGLELVDLGLKVLLVGHGGRELARLVEAWAKDTGKLLEELGRREEGVVLLGQLLDELLVLLQLLERLDVHAGHTGGLGLIAVTIVTEHAHLQVGACNGGEAHSAAETLVAGRIVVLQHHLKLDRLTEVALFRCWRDDRRTERRERRERKGEKGKERERKEKVPIVIVSGWKRVAHEQSKGHTIMQASYLLLVEGGVEDGGNSLIISLTGNLAVIRHNNNNNKKKSNDSQAKEHVSQTNTTQDQQQACSSIPRMQTSLQPSKERRKKKRRGLEKKNNTLNSVTSRSVLFVRCAFAKANTPPNFKKKNTTKRACTRKEEEEEEERKKERKKEEEKIEKGAEKKSITLLDGRKEHKGVKQTAPQKKKKKVQPHTHTHTKNVCGARALVFFLLVVGVIE